MITFPQNRVDELMCAYSGAVPGACVLVLHEGVPVVRQSYGMADLEREIASTSATNYRLASVTKQFTAAAVLMLTEEGVLSLEAPLHEWLPSLRGPAGGATLRQLLTHTSGLIDYEDLILPGRTAQLHDADVLRLLETEARTYFAPGSAYRYSDGGYALLALIVEIVSKQSFATFLRKRIFVPLGMDGTVAHQQGVSTTVWHSGESVGFRNVIVRRPPRRLTVALLTNRDEPAAGPYALALRIAESLSPRC